jgi:N-acetylglucosamine-6-sulfatase
LGRDQSTIATWLKSAGYRTKYLGKYLNGYSGSYVPPGWDEWSAFVNCACDNVVYEGGRNVQLAGNSTDAFADKTSDFIRRSSANPDPFFVMVGTRAPHRPPEVADRHLGSFSSAQLPKPPNFDEADVSDKPAWVRSYPRLTQARIDAEQSLYRQRLRSMLPVEDLLRQVITTLEQTGELNNTYIIFTSDNGFHQGQHRLVAGDKKTPYEEDIGVPLMVRGPGVPAGAVRQQLVINNDLAPTIAELAGASTPAFVDGSSFAPLLGSSPPSSWRTAFLQEGWKPQSPPVPTNKGVRTQSHMYVEYDTGERELYDLSADPYQLQSKPRAGNEQLYSTLESRLNALRACSGEGCRSAEWATTPPPPPTTDTTRPRVTSTSPAANATGIAPSTNVIAPSQRR